MTKQSILIVDDDIISIQVLNNVLVDMGPTIRFLTNSEEVLEFALRSPPDLFILDANMPNLNGFSLCSKIRQSPILRNIPVIFVTANYTPAFETAALLAGASDFLPKPVNPAILVATVSIQLTHKRCLDMLKALGGESS